ncbi:hypothetical protein ACIOJ4_48575, partial [Streptomyces chartreusis]
MGSNLTIAALDGNGTDSTSPYSFDRAREQLTAAIEYFRTWDRNLTVWLGTLEQDGWEGLAASGFGDIIKRISVAHQEILDTASGSGVGGGYIAAIDDAQQGLRTARNDMRTAFESWQAQPSWSPQAALATYAQGLVVRDADFSSGTPAVLVHAVDGELGDVGSYYAWDAVEANVKAAWRQTAEQYLDTPVPGIVAALTSSYQRATTELRPLQNVIRTALNGSLNAPLGGYGDQSPDAGIREGGLDATGGGGGGGVPGAGGVSGDVPSAGEYGGGGGGGGVPGAGGVSGDVPSAGEYGGGGGGGGVPGAGGVSGDVPSAGEYGGGGAGGDGPPSGSIPPPGFMGFNPNGNPDSNPASRNGSSGEIPPSGNNNDMSSNPNDFRENSDYAVDRLAAPPSPPDDRFPSTNIPPAGNSDDRVSFPPAGNSDDRVSFPPAGNSDDRVSFPPASSDDPSNFPPAGNSDDRVSFPPAGNSDDRVSFPPASSDD